MSSQVGSGLAIDNFDAKCLAAQTYPNNCHGRLSAKAREAEAETWDTEASRIFSSKAGNASFKILETCSHSSCNCGLLSKDIKTQDDLTAHLHPNRMDSRLRYVSIQSQSSKSRLKCPVAMFKYLCTYQQIPPSFLTCLYSFRTSHSRYEWCNLPLFNDDNTLLSRVQHIVPVDQLDRSGREIRYSFVLRSVEKSNSVTTKPGPSWAIRQLAVYHSFDVVSGQMFWLTAKGNSLNEEQFKDALSENDFLHPKALESVSGAFSASLDMLSIILDWCDDDWRYYINEIVDEVSRKADKARTVAITDKPDFVKIKRLVTGLQDQPTGNLSRTPTLESGLRLGKFVRAVSFNRNHRVEENSLHLEDDIEKLEALKIFSFDELQILQAALEKIQEALMVLKLNNQVIRRIRDHYQSLMSQYNIPEMEVIQKVCKNSVLQFCRRSRDVEANIQARQEQLDSLLLLVKESKNMYDGILQYKSFQINKIYAESAQLSARKMEDIADKTKQETTSMHIITFVTLIFLPGTFMASFFQSGILEWPPLEPKEKWKLNGNIFGLFFGISLGITLFIIFAWVMIMCMLRRQPKTVA
ncbi:hypothetical protein F53441_4206 [Fusarium austroafricanum]|uniref:CorA-like transporter domain-containing protein n=1 Tax=Fusarium austroafricanum TaxID=2364996 RepID=A0A8H4KMQ9_9HYPO|nr:hypothetical protein F53441_4206 [Fusarium austroafricanum]